MNYELLRNKSKENTEYVAVSDSNEQISSYRFQSWCQLRSVCGFKNSACSNKYVECNRPLVVYLVPEHAAPSCANPRCNDKPFIKCTSIPNEKR